MKVLSGFLFCLAVVLVGVGFNTMYSYGSGSITAYQGMTGHVVGGDAYNYQIIALRGLGFMGAGILAGVMGAAAAICESIATARAPQVQTSESQAHIG